MLSKRDAGLPLPEGFRAQEQAAGHAPYYEGRGEDSVHDSDDGIDNTIAVANNGANGNDSAHVHGGANHNANGGGSGGRGGRDGDASKRKRDGEGDGYRGDGCAGADADLAAAAADAAAAAAAAATVTIESGRRYQGEVQQVKWRKIGTGATWEGGSCCARP